MRQPRDRHQIRHHENNSLHTLRPGNRLHPTKVRAEQDGGQSDNHPNHVVQPKKTAHNNADPGHLGGNIRKADNNDENGSNDAHPCSWIASTNKIDEGVLTKLANIRRQEEGEQDITTGPTGNVRQPLKAKQIERTGHTDERCGTHPVRAGRQSVQDTRHLAFGDIVRIKRIGPRTNTNDRIQTDGQREKTPVDQSSRDVQERLKDGEQCYQQQ